jgi:hypothetical protein
MFGQPISDIEAFLRAIFDPPRGCAEIRVFDASMGRDGVVTTHPIFRSTFTGWFADADEALVAMRSIRDVSAFITINPVDRRLLARSEGLARAKHATSDNDVLVLRNILLDVDPRRPADISSTDAELAAALARRDQVLAENPDIAEASIWGCSGNGGFLLVRVPDLPNDEPRRAMVKEFINLLSLQYSDPTVKLDTATSNPSRVMALVGTKKCKGLDTPERPHRVVELHSDPAKVRQPLDLPAWLAKHRPASASNPAGRTASPDAPKDNGAWGVEVTGDYPDWATRPGDDFQSRAEWMEILSPHGWKIDKKLSSGELRWTRPGKNRGTSATTGHNKGLHIFTDSDDAAPFKAEENYSKFEAFALLNHGGDRTAAVKALIQLGYGSWVDNDGEVRRNPPPTDWRRAPTPPAIGDNGPPQAGPKNRSRKQTTGPKSGDPATRPIVNKHGTWRSCLHNAQIWLNNHAGQFKVRYDLFRQMILINDKPLTDEAVIAIATQLETGTRTPWSQEHVRSALIHVAHLHEFSSLAEWLNPLQWDGQHRMPLLFHKGYGCEDSDYSSACGRVLLISAVARALEPGCQADVMVVLIGPQGIGKSSGAAALVPNPDWFTDDLPDLHDRKPAENLRGKWIVEFGEFSRINRAAVETVKSFLTRRNDRYRPAYGRIAQDFPRTCIFVGSTNDPHPLQDTQNRRFMPNACGTVDLDWIRTNRDQLWAEAVERYRMGEQWWVTAPALLDEVAAKQEDARQADSWEEILADKIGHHSMIGINDVLDALEIKTDRLDKSTQTRFGICLRTIGFARRRVRTGGKLCYVWDKT